MVDRSEGELQKWLKRRAKKRLKPRRRLLRIILGDGYYSYERYIERKSVEWCAPPDRVLAEIVRQYMWYKENFTSGELHQVPPKEGPLKEWLKLRDKLRAQLRANKPLKPRRWLLRVLLDPRYPYERYLQSKTVEWRTPPEYALAEIVRQHIWYDELYTFGELRMVVRDDESGNVCGMTKSTLPNFERI